MPLMSPEEYKQSLNDGRVVYYRGERVENVAAHPVIGIAAWITPPSTTRWPKTRRTRNSRSSMARTAPTRATTTSPKTRTISCKRSALIERATALGGTLVVLIKEIGTDALFALRLLASYMDKNMGTSYLERVRKFHDHCRENDLAVAVAQTDVKGDRGKGPADQAHPDYYGPRGGPG